MLIDTTYLLQANHTPPKVLLPWLRHQDSLTKKLEDHSGEATLEVLKQQWTSSSWWDKFTLGVVAESVLRRNIVMYSQQIPCWFAHTIIPQPTHHANELFFNRLTDESLGVIIFNEPDIQRMQMVNYSISDHCIEYHWLPHFLLNKTEQVWVRLSIFTIAGRYPFYLVEILLPGLLRVIQQ